MYRYDEFDEALVRERVAQFSDQVQRRLNGELNEDEFKPLRLMNGLYLQLHAYMFRIAIPYGTLSSEQLRKLAHVARTYDKGYGHITTRQNMQFNWPRLEDAPAILSDLADAQLHAIQTSGNCIRNTTADQYAGVAADEIADPRHYCEIIRQWSTLHPEFSFLPRKFKIAVTGAEEDRAALRTHDIGLRMRRGVDGNPGFEVMVGGGLGRTPVVGVTIREFLPEEHLLSYLESILRVYNQIGRRDNIHKARIKILVQSVGRDEFARMVEEEWAQLRDGYLTLPQEELETIARYFAPPPYETLGDSPPELELWQSTKPGFAAWMNENVAAHKQPGYSIVNISLKPEGGVPGDITAEQMDVVADLAERYSFSEIRATHEQNLVLPYVRKPDLMAVWQGLQQAGLATANIGLISDMICCPGLDYCNLANARSIPVAQEISERFADLSKQRDIGPLKIKMSGCINACGHHHVGHIGILGVDKKGQEYYQITLGGSAENETTLGNIVGPAFSAAEIGDAMETIVETYLKIREEGEAFLETYRRVGQLPFKETLYAAH